MVRECVNREADILAQLDCLRSGSNALKHRTEPPGGGMIVCCYCTPRGASDRVRGKDEQKAEREARSMSEGINTERRTLMMQEEDQICSGQQFVPSISRTEKVFQHRRLKIGGYSEPSPTGTHPASHDVR